MYGCTDSNSVMVNLLADDVYEIIGNNRCSLNIFSNPINPEAVIEFKTTGDCWTSLKIFDLQGRLISDLFNEFSNSEIIHRIKFDGSKLDAGVYLLRLVSGNYSESKRIVIIN